MSNDQSEHWLTRYNKGTFAAAPKLTDYWHTQGYEDANRGKSQTSEYSESNPANSAITPSEGKRWPIWLGFLLAIAATVYSVLYVESFWAGLGIVFGAAFCGFLLPVLFRIFLILALFGVVILSPFLLFALFGQ